MAIPIKTASMEQSQAIDILVECFQAKVDRNPRYSARALARDISVSPAFISMLFSGKKKLSLNRARQISRALGLGARKTKQFLRAVMLESLRDGKQNLEDVESVLSQAAHEDVKNLELDQFQFFSQWYHIAILDLTLCADFEPSPEWIGRRLGLLPTIANDATERLVRLGLLTRENGTFRKTDPHLALSPRAPDGAVRKFHRQMIEKAREILDDSSPEAFSRRDVSGITMAVDASKLQEARALIKEFKRRMADLLTAGEARSVYQLNVQLFPLSREDAPHATELSPQDPEKSYGN